jgi:regulator of replication initiation timing
MNNLPDYTELTELRITNHQLRDRVATLEAALKTDVLKIAKVAIYQAAIDAGKASDADTIGCMGVELDDVKAENAKLKAEAERLRKAGDRMAAALNGEYNYELPCVEDWNAAKDGKLSE